MFVSNLKYNSTKGDRWHGAPVITSYGLCIVWVKKGVGDRRGRAEGGEGRAEGGGGETRRERRAERGGQAMNSRGVEE